MISVAVGVIRPRRIRPKGFRCLSLVVFSDISLHHLHAMPNGRVTIVEGGGAFIAMGILQGIIKPDG